MTYSWTWPAAPSRRRPHGAVQALRVRKQQQQRHNAPQVAQQQGLPSNAPLQHAMHPHLLFPLKAHSTPGSAGTRCGVQRGTPLNDLSHQLLSDRGIQIVDLKWPDLEPKKMDALLGSSNFGCSKYRILGFSTDLNRSRAAESKSATTKSV